MERIDLASLLCDGRAPSSPNTHASMVVAESCFESFRATFAAAVAGKGICFLADPSWGDAERAQLEQRLASIAIDEPSFSNAAGWLAIPTGGSSGVLRWARHDQSTIREAVNGFRRHFALDKINAIGVLPMHHVSGLMGWMRCVLSGGVFVSWNWKRLLEGDFPPHTKFSEGTFLSLVPTQLERLLDRPQAIAWLREFRAVLIGGGPSWQRLWERASEAKLPLCFSYGATETAAMVCAQKPGDFAHGARDVGCPMPHARVSVGPDGRICVSGNSLFRGYFPDYDGAAPRIWETGDIGSISDAGTLEVMGRIDDVIISGGEKVAPLEVENALRATGAFDDVAVLGCADSVWGACVVAAYAAPREKEIDWNGIEAFLQGALAAFKRPRLYVHVSEWPRNAQGKLQRARLRDVVEAQIRQHVDLHAVGCGRVG